MSIVAGRSPSSTRNRLDDIGPDRDSDEEAGHVIEDKSRGGRVRILERSPHCFSRTDFDDFMLLVRLTQSVVQHSFGVLALPIPIVLVAAVTFALSGEMSAEKNKEPLVS
jgi:hypothetical protein